MFHEETIINGILHWRGTPTGAWIPYSAEKLTERVNALAAELAASERYRENLSQAHVDQAERIRELKAAMRKIVRDGDYTAPEGMKRIAQEALGSELETAVEREECPQCGGQGHIKVYADGVFQKAIDCGMCSAPNRGAVGK